MNTRRLISAIAGFAFAIAMAPAGAVVLLSDNFDADSPVSVLNFNGFINWTVDSGTVDYIRSGNFGISCLGGAGGCVDSDGSTSNAGRLVSRAVFVLPAGTSGTISVQASGNQRGGAADTLLIGFVLEDLSPAFTVPCLRNPSDPYSNCGLSFITEVAVSVRAVIEGVGGDNEGVVFDNFLLTADIAQAPEPLTLALLGVGLAGLGFSRRRRAAS